MSGEWVSRQIKDQTEPATREEIVKWNQMTALRFQTGGRHKKSLACLYYPTRNWSEYLPWEENKLCRIPWCSFQERRNNVRWACPEVTIVESTDQLDTKNDLSLVSGFSNNQKSKIMTLISKTSIYPVLVSIILKGGCISLFLKAISCNSTQT